MADRKKIPLSFGGGMDRATGVFEVGAENFIDLRNVYLYRSRMEARKGIAAVNTFVDDAAADVDDVVLIAPMRSEQLGVVIGYQDGDRELHVYRVDGDGTGTDRIGAWGTLPANAHEPPRVLATESYRKLFFAHDEVVFSRRLSTYYYDPFVGTPLVQLQADLDGAGDAPLYFRGVTRHLDYVIGWGFGTASEQSRPEIVRISMPGDPTSWNAEHYVIAGVRDDPVIRCESMGATPSPLTVFKETETYTIFGHDRRTFGIRRIDDIYGLASARLAITVNGVCYFWTFEGPRATSGNGPSKDLSWPLDLDAPAPATLVAEGAIEDGFVEYLPGRRVVLFTFGKRVYALSIWNPEDPKWSYGEMGYEVFCGGRLSSGGEAQSAPPTAAPSAVTAPGKTGATDTITVAWINNSIDGDEFVEIWMKEESQSWAREKVVLAVAASSDPFAQVWQVDETGPTFVDETVDANSAANADWQIFPTTEAPTDYVALGFAQKFSKVLFDNLNGTAGVGGVVTWEYWDGTAWTALAGVTDGTTGFTATVADDQALTFTVPTDWATQSLNGSAMLYYIRARVTTVYTTNPVYDQGFVVDTQATDVTGLTAGKDHQVALRYRRGPYYSPDSSDSSDPWVWPAAQRATGGTLAAPPVLDSTSWTRVSAGVEKNVLNWTNTHADKETKIYRDGDLIDTVAAGVATYDDTAAVGETDEVYKLRHVTAGGDSADSNELTQWTGPDQPPTITELNDGLLTYIVTWANGDASLKTEVWSTTPVAGLVLDLTKNAGETSSTTSPAGASGGDNCEVKIRHKKTEFGIDDFSDYDIDNVTLTDP